MASKRYPPLAIIIAAVLAAGSARAQTPPSTLDQYVLFGSNKVAGKNVMVTSGAIGSEHAIVLQSQSAFSSDLVGSLVRLSTGSFGHVYARALLGVDSVADLQRWTPIIDGLSFRDPLGLFDDLGAACNFPVPPTCSGPSITVPEGVTVTVPAGVYGDLKIKGGLDPVTQQPMPGGVILPGGTYTFCNIQVASRGTILVQNASQIRVAGNLKLARGAYLGPASTSTIDSSAIGVFVGGTRVKFGGSSTVLANTCAPYAKCGVAGGHHAGGLWCDSLRIRNAQFSPVSPPGCTVACDDGNDCTDDVCSGAQCLNIPQNGTACLIGGVTPGICSQGTCLSTPTTSIPPPSTTSTTTSTSSTSTSSTTSVPPTSTTSTSLPGTTTTTAPPASTTTSTAPSASTTTSTAPPASTTTSTAPPASTTTSTAPSASTTTSTAPPASTTTSTAPPATTTSTTAPPATTTSTTAPPATTTSTTAPPATTTSTTAPPATTASTTAPPATTTSTTAPPATTTSTTAAPTTTTSTTTPPPTSTSTTFVATTTSTTVTTTPPSPSGAFVG